MASETQETLYRIFAALSGETGSLVPVSAAGAMTQGGSGVAGGEIARSVASGVAGAIQLAVTNAKDQGGGAGDIALSVAKSGLGLVPLASLVFGLFGGGEKEEAPPLVKYALPPRRGFEAAETATGLAGVDYDQSGMPRLVERGAAAAAPQITVNVQAMDARSFLDRSSEIAAAVREAMLNLNSINDVVTDL